MKSGYRRCVSSATSEVLIDGIAVLYQTLFLSKHGNCEFARQHAELSMNDLRYPRHRAGVVRSDALYLLRLCWEVTYGFKEGS